jgi:TatD DNase family protein
MIDAHCHLQHEAFGNDSHLADLLSEARRYGITQWVVNGTSERDWEKVATLAWTHPEIIPSFGLHPWYIKDRCPGWLEKLEFWIDQFPQAGIGEIGLDRWIKNYDLADQQTVFEQQWLLAVQKNRPISLHCLRAWGPLEQTLKHLPKTRFLLHSYSGAAELVPLFAKSGAYFSISGYFLRSDKADKVDCTLAQIPLARLLLETDAPDMRLPPELDHSPDRSYNHPANLAVIYQEIAQRKNLPLDEFKTQIAQNFSNFWSVVPKIAD